MTGTCLRLTHRGTVCGRGTFSASVFGRFEAPACMWHMTREEKAAREVALADAEAELANRVSAHLSWPALDRGQLLALEITRGGSESSFSDDVALCLWQAGRCAVCGRQSSNLVTDHDHATGLVRGLLCLSCNRREGLSDSGDLVAYRERPPTAILGLEITYWSAWYGFAVPESDGPSADVMLAAVDRLRIRQPKGAPP